MTAIIHHHRDYYYRVDSLSECYNTINWIDTKQNSLQCGTTYSSQSCEKMIFRNPPL